MQSAVPAADVDADGGGRAPSVERNVASAAAVGGALRGRVQRGGAYSAREAGRHVSLGAWVPRRGDGWASRLGGALRTKGARPVPGMYLRKYLEEYRLRLCRAPFASMWPTLHGRN